MYTKLNHNQLAKYALWLVTLAIFVCSSQNIGFGSACALKHSVDPISHSASLHEFNRNQIDTGATDNSTVPDQCSLSDHLLQIHQQQLEQAIVSFIFIVLTFVLFAGPSLIAPELIEPIPPARRRHLTLCVFRE